ncbi:MAG: NADP-dependent malic enzyme [Thermodesulfovibrionales bacterium]|nr:NADP-dependent malic enzyme [Thermodesulfovibrionales bacterium]
MKDNKLIEEAERYSKEALRLHGLYRGKVEMLPKCPIRGLDDFSIWYTPGVAEVCKEIAKNKEKVFEYTNRGNTVAIISDGTRVLGLGNIGPEAALPVMEGKAIIFKYLGAVDAFPVVLNTADEDEILKICKYIAPSFGGINLEDIEKPKCFSILERLKKELDIPVWHDDQQGTATVTLAALINALKVVGKRKEDVKIAMIGAGAANTATFRLLTIYGIPSGNIIVVDSAGILNRERKDLMADAEKWKICNLSNSENRKGGIKEALEGADVCIALSRPGPGVIEKEWIKDMKRDPVVFACANPVPEIWPWEAKEAGARIVATGRSDFPNQVNNSLCFPGLFRGVLDVQSRAVTDEMCIASAIAIAEFAEKKGIREDYIIPTMDEVDVFVEVAVAAGMKAVEQGLARKVMNREELSRTVKSKIEEARDRIRLIMEKNLK